jgi:ribosome-associated protein
MSSISFVLQGDHIELCNLLKCVGLVDSSGAGKHLVALGGVFVDGLAEGRKTAKIREGQLVEVQDLKIAVIAGSDAEPTVPKAAQ